MSGETLNPIEALKFEVENRGNAKYGRNPESMVNGLEDGDLAPVRVVLRNIRAYAAGK